MNTKQRASRLGKILSRRMLPALLALCMGLSMALPGALQAWAAESTLENLTGVSGTWVEETDGIHATAAGPGANSFALADNRVEADELFTYEATVSSTSTNGDFNASLVYGVVNRGNPSERFYDFGIMVGSDRFCRFDQVNGVLSDAGFDQGAIADKESFELKIVRTSLEDFEFYIDGSLVLNKKHPDFAGGFVGMMTNDVGVYNDISLAIDGKVAGFVSNLDGWKPHSGTWTETDAGYEGVCVGNNFLISGKTLGADALFVYEADMTPKTEASGIVFGIRDPQNPTARWYCFNVVRDASGNDVCMLFDQTDGTPNVLKAEPLTAEEKGRATYRMKVVREDKTTFKFYLDEREVYVQNFDGYDGGYLGVMSTGTGAFNNVRLTETGTAGDGFLTNLSGWRGVTGSWSETGSGLKGSGAGNVFAMSTKAVDAHSPFTFEAEMTLPLDQAAAGIVFGATDPTNPTAESWYCMNIDRGGPISRIFSQFKGSPSFYGDISLTEQEKNQTVYKLKVVRETQDGPIKFYLGDRLLPTGEIQNFPGGYFGVMTAGSEATFNKIYYTVNGQDKGFSSNLTDWTPLNGAWTVEAGGYQGIHGGGNTFAYAKSKEVASEDTFIYEADVEIKPGNHGAGLIFGVKNPENGKAEPDYLSCLMAVKGDGNIMFFSHKDGGDAGVQSKGMSDGDKNTNIYHMRVEYLGSKTVNLYVNGTLYYTESVPQFDGGYFGLMLAANTTATFDNVNYMKATKPELENIELIGAQPDKAFDKDIHAYWADVEHGVDSVKVKAQFDDDLYDLTIAGQPAAPDQEITVGLADGLNAVQVVVRDPESDLSDTYTYNITRQPNPETLYKETARPQFHFTPYMYQMNDPNGLVYDSERDEYHLFFQCNRPFDTGVEGLSGTTGWGHAISKDMINWEEQPMAITPDKLGWAYSGSGVIDYHNTSGLFEEDPASANYTPPGSRIVLFYANVAGDNTHGYAKQSMAYSTDGGRTFIKYPGNPVVKNPGNIYGGGMRDPKVFWYEDEALENGGTWVMVTVGDLHIFTSPNLIDWTHCGRPQINGQVFDSECPDLFPLPVDGDPNNVKWVYTGGGIFYVLGHMEVTAPNKVMFVPETDKIYALNGIADQGPGNPAPETYATQTFNNEKEGRVISISWLRDPSHAWKDKNWNSAQSIPMEHSLRTVNGQVKLFSYPAKEVDAMRDEVILSLKDVAVDENSENVLKNIQSTSCDIDATITLGTATQVGFKLRKGEAGGGQELVVAYNREDGKLYVDKTKTGSGSYLGVYEPDMALLDGDKINLRMLLDQICFDVYGNGGEAAVAGLIYTEFENASMEFFTNGTATIDELTIYSMKTMDRTLPDPAVPTQLTGLTLDSALLEPLFSQGVTAYTASVPYSVDAVKARPVYTGDTPVTVNGKAVDSEAYSEEIELAAGETTEITVVAGTTTYTIQVTRAGAAADPSLDGVEFKDPDVSLDPPFDPDIFQYTATVPHTVESFRLIFTGNIQATLDGAAFQIGADGMIPLKVGENTVVVTAGENEYTFVITREPMDPDAPILTLRLESGDVTIEIGPDGMIDPADLAPYEEKEGYIFLGWYTGDGKPFDFDTVVQDDLTLIPQWRKEGEVTKPEDPDKPGGSGNQNSGFKWPDSWSSGSTGKDNPQSGDGFNGALALLALAGAAGTVVIFARRKK